MNKKHLILGITLIFLVATLLFVLLSNNSNINDIEKQLELKEAFDLDIIVNLKKYTSEEYDEEKLLDVAMQLATKRGLLSEYDDETTYIQYVSKDDIHLIINELTGITVEAPIEIEDSYYLYDSENEYYYCWPSTLYYYNVTNIISVIKNGDTYEFICTLEKNIDSEIEKIENVIIRVSEMPENTVIKYKVEEIKFWDLGTSIKSLRML